MSHPDVPAKPGAPAWLGILIVVVLLFAGGAIWYTPNADVVQHTAAQDIDNILFAFQSMARGDMISAIDYLVQGIPIFAMFMILFGITHFIFTTALKHIFKRRTATLMALIVSCYGFVDTRIYNYMLNLNAFTVGFLVFSLLLIFIWGLSREGLRNTKESFDEVKEWKEKFRNVK